MAIVKIVNAEGGSDARYDVSQMTAEERTRFDSEGRPLGADNPDQWTWTPGLPGARGGIDQYNQGGGGGGAGAGAYANPQIQSLVQSQSAADRSATIEAIQQALIRFGLVPEGFKDPLGALDNLTRDLAQKNTNSGISLYARLLESRKDAITNLMSRLSASGLRRSGARGKKLRTGQLDFDRAFQDSLSQLMDMTGGLYKNFANNEYSRQMQLLQSIIQGTGYGGGGGGGGSPGGSFNVGGYSVPSSVGTFSQPNQAAAAAPFVSSFGSSSPSKPSNTWTGWVPS